MGCQDCNKKPEEAIRYGRRIKPQMPSGYTGCYLRHLGLALPESPVLGAYYSLPRVASDGTIIYAQEHDDQKPPPDINGYMRCADDPFRFYPLWGECLMRMGGLRYNRDFGFVDVVMICNHPACPHAGKYLSVVDCVSCSNRLGPTNE
jgi:hypothetical protein